MTIIFSGINYFYDGEIVKKPEIKKEIKKEVKKPEIKKEVKKPEPKKNIEQKKERIKSKENQKLEVKRKNVDEVILPDLNLNRNSYSTF